MPKAERKARIPSADGEVPQARSHLAFIRGEAAPSAACKFTMKVIKWAGAGASLLDPVSAHLIAPKYEHELPLGSGKCEYFGAGLRECRRHGAILAFILSGAARSAAWKFTMKAPDGGCVPGVLAHNGI